MQGKVYEDVSLRERAKRIISAQQQGKIVVSKNRDAAGVPNMDYLGLKCTSTMKTEHTFAVEGMGWLDSDYDTGEYVFILKEGERPPKWLEEYKVQQLCEAELDESEHICTIKTDKELITFTAVETWREGYEMLSEINAALNRSNAGVAVWRITSINPEKAKSSTLFPTSTPSVSNNETRLPVTGYAFASTVNTLVYLGIVGYKTAINSMMATLWQSKPLSLYAYGTPHQSLYPFGKYQRLITPMPDYDAHHCLAVNHRAVPGMWTPDDNQVFILAFIGSESVESQLVSRLNETLNIPILPEWGSRIIEEGYVRKYICDLETGGDCLRGISIEVKNADWIQLVKDLLVSETIAV